MWFVGGGTVDWGLGIGACGLGIVDWGSWIGDRGSWIVDVGVSFSQALFHSALWAVDK